MRLSKKIYGLIVPCLCLVSFLVPSSAVAVAGGAQWSVSAVARPSVFAVGSGEDSYSVLVTNTGSSANEEEPEPGKLVPVPVTVVDELPSGVEALSGVNAEDQLGAEGSKQGGSTPGANFSTDCAPTGSGGVSCTFSGVVVPDDSLILTFPVKATSAGQVRNVVRAFGGGAAAPGVMETSTLIAANAVLAGEDTVFGVAGGGPTTTLSSVQAGAHADLTTTGGFDTLSARGVTAGAVKSISDDLPAGFAGDLIDTPVCQSQEFLHEECPVPSQVGITTQVFLHEEVPNRKLLPVYNLAPEPGEVAKIGFNVPPDHIVGDIAVRAPGEACVPAAAACEAYGLKTTFYNITAGVIDFDSFSLTIWGVPAAPVHDPLRWQSQGGGFFGVSDGSIEAPYLTNPTVCGSTSLEAGLHVTSWQHPNASESPPVTSMAFGPIVGCSRLLMEPVLAAEATSDGAYQPTGFNLDTGIPQTYENAQGLATSALKQEIVTLPEGVTVNPSSGAGLSACTEAQYAEEGAPEKTAVEKEQGHGCPASSKLATVKIKSPSISEEVTGAAYLAEPAPRGETGKNPFNTLLSLYLIARAADRGVLIKVPGKVQANEVTGQLTTTFGATPAFGPEPASGGLPPLPASEITFQFNQGANAPLVTPPTCGLFTVTAQLTPWSDPEGTPLDPLIPPFPISTNCPPAGAPPFAPAMTAYPIHANAGAYSPLYLKITRNDGEQEITGFATEFPPGLTGNLSSIEKCSETDVQRAREQTGHQAESEPACPKGSEIGYSIAEAGVGSILAQNPGKIYLGEKFEGAPFSIIAVTSADVGPFDLGTVVIHFPLDINPRTAVVSIPSGPADQIPHIIKGIVVHLRSIRAYIDRENFMINPASCEPMTLSATVIGGGADPTNPADSDPVMLSDPFQAADCSSLKFAPKFSVSTSGKTSKALGASLTVHLTYPPNALTHDANIHLVKVELPKALPSRLTTLQKACTAAVFKANPANCPAASIIGHAKVVTPILPVPLEGPAYFVSNGGEAFPNLIMVLQGYGVTIELVGDTFISKSGITSSTFKSVPDEPVGSFELTLPEGPYSALAANGNLCAETKTTVTKKKVSKRVHGKLKKVTVTTKKTTAEKLTLPTEFIASNGAEVHQQTPVEVTGCPKAKKAVKKAKGKAKHKKK